MATARKVGRPPNPDMAAIKAAICNEIAGGLSLAKVCAQKDFPPVRTVMTWLREDVEFQQHYARAREERADAIFDEMDEVAEQAATSNSAVEVAGLRLKMDTIKWKLARMNAKKYGEKIAVGGADDLPAIKQDVNLTPDEAYLRMIGK